MSGPASRTPRVRTFLCQRRVTHRPWPHRTWHEIPRPIFLIMLAIRRRLAASSTAACFSSTSFHHGRTGLIYQQQQFEQQHRRWSSNASEDEPKKRTLNLKKKSKSSGKGEDGTDGAVGGRDKYLELALASLDAPRLKEPPISAEEKARRYRIGRNYVIGRFEQHNELNHDLSCKMKLKNHAIKMLPKNNSKLREEALKVDENDGPPLWRLFATWTPPIPNFTPTQFAGREKEV